MKASLFEIKKMDCPSEENLIRLKLEDIQGIEELDFDLTNRHLTVYHTGPVEEIDSAIHSLNLNSRLIRTELFDSANLPKQRNQRKLLWTVLVINFSFFVIEITTGWISKSMGLVADSLDMLADSFVYGLSLFAVGGSLILKKQIAKVAGYFQMLLAILGFFEVVRRFFGISEMPDFFLMIGVSILALVANAICLYLLQKSRSQDEAHMKASMIFTSNDIIINLGVIAAGCAVYFLRSNIPDLVIGAIVFVLVLQGAERILKLGD
jgi:Co/Zn/Cd efflux system component